LGSGKKLTLFIVGGLVVAVLLVWAGVLLGLSPMVRDGLSGLFSSDTVANAENCDLQQEIIDDLESHYYQVVDEDSLQRGAVDGLVGSLDDPYTVYMDPEEYAYYQERISGEYSGVGMTVVMNDSLVTVVSTFEGSPAERAGIESGDIITAVDGTSTEGQNLDEVVLNMRGPEGTSVTLTVYRPPMSTTTTTVPEGQEETPDLEEQQEEVVDLTKLPPGGETVEHDIVRQTIDIPAADSEMLAVGDKEVAHVSLFDFSVGSAEELRADVEQAIENEGADAIILDLRGNLGGIVGEAVDVTSIFVAEGVVVTIEGLHSPAEVYEVTGNAYPDVPLYVLVDEFSASASEIVSGALQDYHRATLIGETTFGKGLVQVIYPLSNGGALKMTTAEYFTPSGRNINKVGIEPDVTAPDDPATQDVDETLEEALDLIAGTTSAGR